MAYMYGGAILLVDLSYYESHGEGEALVLIMGYGSSSGWWFRQ